MTAINEHTGTLQVQDIYGAYRPASAEEIIRAARTAINRRFRRGTALTSPAASQDFPRLRLGTIDHEVFAVLWLDNRHRIISFDMMFRGTIDGASVYPREVVKTALGHNAAACVLAHNHPSGIGEPSQADRAITARLQEALALVDVRVLDHIIAAEQCVSFAERGLL